MKLALFAASLLPALLAPLLSAAPGDAPHGPLREKAAALQRDGNYREAFDIYEKLTLDPKGDALRVGSDLEAAVACLQRLNRSDETDSLRERAISAHPANWRLLFAAARSYYGDAHYGFLVAGEFHRGQHRGGGRYVSSEERDRVRALQLMEAARERSGAESDRSALADFHLQLANMLLGYRGHGEAWRLQHLTDLKALPDFEEGYGYRDRSGRGAPVGADGEPVYHARPESYEQARSDGERWRWALSRAAELRPELEDQVLLQLADFLRDQFDVQTLAEYGPVLRREPDEAGRRAGIYTLHTLGEDETLARLATGIRRFRLPEEFNFLRIYRRVAENARSGQRQSAAQRLAEVFENRMQYERAAELWKQAGNRAKVEQILGSWGQFEPEMTHPAGQEASVGFRFRNGRKVSFEAREIRVRELLDDVKGYLRSDPGNLEWEKLDISNIGYRLVQKDEAKYLGPKVAEWDLALEPRERHFDRRITVRTPLRKAGAYLLTARMASGNVSKIVLWLDDTVLVRRQLADGAYFFAADAATGEPLPRLNLEFFGYRQEAASWEKLVGRRYHVRITNFAEHTDESGQLIVGSKDFDRAFQWMIVARNKAGRLAYLGFSGVWYGGQHDREYNETKVFTVTDRPVYRPNQPVRFKLWVRQAQYDREDSPFAGRDFSVQAYDPKGDKVFEKSFRADDFGGFDGEYLLPADAALGVYRLQVSGYSGGSFRVEEYRKPEFEVKVEAPAEPAMLGEKIAAKIEARYYFGAPVTRARVHYKILRSEHDARWYPPGLWDWLYGPGYGWFGYDYEWYPGWRDWGCRRPAPWWWPVNRTPPEVVADAEVEIGTDGTVPVTIDTALAKELHGDADHRYEITAEVVDESRRTIVGKGEVLVARKPFQVTAWVDRGHYRVGDPVRASFAAQTLDRKPVQGKGVLNLYRVEYRDGKPVETGVQRWELDTDAQGRAQVQLKASRAGQYRLSYQVTDARGHGIEGGYLFAVRGEGDDEKGFRFGELELVPDRREYAPGDRVRLSVNTDRPSSTVVLFLRPANGVYTVPRVLRLTGKSRLEEIEISRKDMPNFFVEAFTVSSGKLYTETREIAVPPEKRVLNVEVVPSAERYKPREKAKVRVRLTDFAGRPVAGSAVLSVYDRAVEYISGGSNVPEIRAFFWKWRRQHNPASDSSLDRYFANLVPPGQRPMEPLGVFGTLVADEGGTGGRFRDGRGPLREGGLGKGSRLLAAPAAAPPMTEAKAEAAGGVQSLAAAPDQETGTAVEPAVRKEFADTAFWAASVATDRDGVAEVEFPMPENLTGWTVKAWAMGPATAVGESSAPVVTAKDLLLRLQAPRFLVERDEVVLSANIHNYLKRAKRVRAVLELPGAFLEPVTEATQAVDIPADGEQRVDWRVKVLREGEATVRMKALTDEESDAMEVRVPVFVHGMLKTESWSGAVRPEQEGAAFAVTVPAERRVDQTRLELRYSPTLAGAMVDALPYLADYPYGCTEQTLNRFVPTVLTQKILRELGLDLAAIREKRTNLNAQELGGGTERAKQWQRWSRNPVFDETTVRDMVRQGLKRLTAMQLSDGGWGWFSGWGERSYPHTTATVVHGLQLARENGAALVPGVLENGVRWLQEHQAGEVRKLRNAAEKIDPWKARADNLDAFVYMVLADAGVEEAEMGEFLFRDRTELAVYGLALYGMGLHRRSHADRLTAVLRNIEQYLVEDAENQTAYLNLPGSQWWYWYGSEYEAHAYYLKLLARTDPKSARAAGLAKYLLNNRKNATYWNSTRDTALCVEALADYLRASGEGRPDMTVEIYVDGKRVKQARITPETLFSFDNALVLEGKALTSGPHRVELRRLGKGPLYWNAYLTNFTLEDFITKAGLEIKVDRKVYRLHRADRTIQAAGARGQALDQRVERYEREELANLAPVKSGDLIEVELTIESKNDYEYLLFEDLKAAGFEPVEVRSGYGGNDLGAYMELRDERVAFFVRALARGRHSVSYRLRAEAPGRFSALPARAHAMYAPELRANSDEIKLRVED